MRKALLVIGVLVFVASLAGGAFAGGLVIGRVTGQSTPATEVVIEPVQGTDAPDPTPTPLPTESAEVLELDELEDTPTATATAESDAGDAADGDPTEDFNYDLVRTVLELLEEQYYGEMPDGDDLAYGAVRGMLMTLEDPYTSFIEPGIAAILNEDASGEFEGIGAMVTMREDGYLVIASLIPGQPAEAAGVLPDDIIVAVGDQSIVGLGLYEAISYIRGPEGTDAELEIIRPGEPERVYVTVARARIAIPIIESEMLEDGIAYLRLTEFDETATERVEGALSELLAENPRALIFDLRSNPGGWLVQAIGVADVFLDEGLVAIQRDSSGNEQRFPSTDGDVGEEIPMVVLVDGGSASAAEIVAGALQDRGRAILIGTLTLGKGSVQLPNNLDDGSQVRITIARWFTPDEQDLHSNGLTPDIEAEYSPDPDAPEGEDSQLERAIEYLNETLNGN